MDEGRLQLIKNEILENLYEIQIDCNSEIESIKQQLQSVEELMKKFENSIQNLFQLLYSNE